MATPAHSTHEDSDIEKVSISQVENIGLTNVVIDEKVQDAGARFAAAKVIGALDPFSRAAFVIYCCTALGLACACVAGYDASLMNAINNMPYYQAQFKPGKLSGETGIIFSIFTVGQMTGSWFAGPISDRFGRRAGMFVGCVGVCIGAAVISSATAKPQFIGGRFLLGFGTAISVVGAALYVVECAPPQWRGRLTAFHNTGLYMGAICGAGITFATSKIKSNWSWKIPLIGQCVPASIIILTVWLMPESPRWLYQNKRFEEACAFLIDYHGNGDPNNPIVQLEIEEFKEVIALDASDKRWWDYSALVKTKNARWRSLMVVLMGLFSQMSGNGLGYFNINIYESLGYNDNMKWVLNLVNAFVAAISSWIGTALADQMPRRRVLVWGTLVCACMLACNTAFSARWDQFEKGHKDLRIGQLGVASFFLFNAAYAFTYTPLQALYTAECLENTARAKGVSMKIFVFGCTSFMTMLCTPIGLANIGWKYVLVFVCWDLFETVIWYFFAVETQGRTLEELDLIFSAPNPVKASKQRSRVTVDEDGVVHVVAGREEL